MTVAELIKKLQEVEDSSKEVLVQYFDDEMMCTQENYITEIFTPFNNNKLLYLSVI